MGAYKVDRCLVRKGNDEKKAKTKCKGKGSVKSTVNSQFNVFGYLQSTVNSSLTVFVGFFSFAIYSQL